MVDVVVILAVGLLVGAIVGTVIPLVPGGLLSIAGLLVYWWHSGFTEPGILAMAVLLTLGVLTFLAELFGSSLAAKAGGASWTTTALAAAVGLVLMIVTGPLGLLVGLFGTVFLVEYRQNGDIDRSARVAAYATGGVLASTAIQVLLTTTILVGFLIAVVVL